MSIWSQTAERSFRLRLLLPVVVAVACGGTETPATPPPPDTTPSALVAVSDTLLSGTAGGVASPAPTVIVKTKAGSPVVGATVHFEAAAGSGSVTTANAITGADGFATTTWILGTTVVRQTVTASVSGTIPPVVFASTPKAAAATALIKVDGDSQSVTVGASPAKVPTVRATDQFGNAVAGVGVTATVLSGGGNITAGAAVTDASGVARFAGWTVGTRPGVNQLVVSAGAASATFLATAVVGAPESIAFDSPDSLRLAVGDSIDLTVHAADHYGNPVPTSSVTVTLVDGTVARAAGLRVTALQPGATSIVAQLGALSASRPLVVLGHPDGSAVTKTLPFPSGTGAVALAGGRLAASTSVGAGPTFRGALVFYDTSGIALTPVISVATSALLRVALTPDGATALATTDVDSTIYFVDFATQAVTTLHVNGIAFLIKISANGTRAYVSTSFGLSVVDLTSRVVLGLIPTGNPFNAMTSTNSDSLFYFAGFGFLTEVDVTKQVITRDLRALPTNWIAASPDGKYLYSAATGNEIDIIRISDAHVVASVPVSGQPNPVAVSPDGKYVYAATDAGLLYRVNVTNPASPVVDRTTPLSNVAFDMAMDARGSFLVIAGRSVFVQIIR